MSLINFSLIKTGVDTTLFKQELFDFLNQGGGWSLERSRAIFEQRDTKHISLRKVVVGSVEGLSKKEAVELMANSDFSELDKRNYPFFQKTYSFLESFADGLGGQLTRVMVVSLKPQGYVSPHIDQGRYYLNKNRYHLAIKTKGSVNICNGERQVYYEGDLWWFDNKKIHEAYNDSPEERIHIIFDVLSRKRTLMRRIKDFFEKKAAILARDLKDNTKKVDKKRLPT